MDKVKVKIVNKSGNALPTYSTAQSAGMDLRAWLAEPVTLAPLERRLISTGVYIELPPGYECQIRPRSGMALKRGLTVLNTPGTIDADYRGEVCVILVNLSGEPQTIENGERICQMVVAQHSTVEWEPVASLEESDRGAGGFGHTGTK
ncbi:MAG: dUTP diphosphatase [Muribaculaceae bacterium]|nr:dUTP diphosphatase [Muribaculaceae bacterium]